MWPHAGAMPAENSLAANSYTSLWQACSTALAETIFSSASTSAWQLSTGEQLLHGPKALRSVSATTAPKAVFETGQLLLRYLQAASLNGDLPSLC